MDGGLYGEFYHNIDPKGRVILPAQFRDLLGEHFQISKGADRCLCIYPLDVWREFEHRLNAIPDVSNPKVRQVKRLLIGGSQDCEMDRQGRFLVPGSLRTYANLQKDIVLVGIGTRIEIWDLDRYNELNTQDNLDEAFAAMGEYGL